MDALAAVLVVWLPLATGVVAVAGALAGAHRAWIDQRRAQGARLADAARAAERLAEAAYVRPLLRRRLEASVEAFLADGRRADHATTARLRLFCRLTADVRLDPAEKRTARVHAYNELVELLRAMPHPPVRVRGGGTAGADPADADADDAALARAAPRLVRALEVAYNLAPRPAGTLIAELGAFAGGLGPLESARPV